MTPAMCTLSGFLTWVAWGVVYLEFLAQSNLRISVFVKSVWTYTTRQRERHQSFFARRREKCANARHAFNRIHGLHLAGTLLSRERQRRSAVDLSNLSLI